MKAFSNFAPLIVVFAIACISVWLAIDAFRSFVVVNAVFGSR
jgi:hypothetical protein